MAGRSEEGAQSALVERKSGFEDERNSKQSLDFSESSLGQNCPSDYPQQENELGEALTIREVSRMLGCSAWTVRQRYLPRGLPHFRIGSAGKLVFYRTQVTRWILEQQERGNGRR